MFMSTEILPTSYDTYALRISFSNVFLHSFLTSFLLLTIRLTISLPPSTVHISYPRKKPTVHRKSTHCDVLAAHSFSSGSVRSMYLTNEIRSTYTVCIFSDVACTMPRTGAEKADLRPQFLLHTQWKAHLTRDAPPTLSSFQQTAA